MSWDYFPQTLFPNQAQLERQRKRHWRAELVPSLKLDRVCLRWSWLDERWRSIGVSVEEFFRPAVRPRPCVRTYLHVLPAILHWQGVYGKKGCTGQKGQCWMILSQRWNVRFDFTVNWCFVCKGVLYIYMIYIIIVISYSLFLRQVRVRVGLNTNEPSWTFSTGIMTSIAGSFLFCRIHSVVELIILASDGKKHVCLHGCFRK